jgi:two-component system cell cycle sensor histidine kinase/response regulator CckA
LLHARRPFRDFVLKHRDAKGNIGFTSISGAPVFDANGDLKGYRGVGKDVTGRKLSGQRRAMEHAVTRLLAQADDPSVAIPNIIQTICEILGWDYGAFWSVDKQTQLLRQTHTWHVQPIDVTDFINDSRKIVATLENTNSVEEGGIIRRARLTQEPLWVVDVTRDPTFQRASSAAKAGLHSAFAFPVLVGEKSLGVMEFYHREIHQR